MNLCRVKFRDHQRLHARRPAGVFGADVQGHGRSAARGQRLGRRPARQRHPLQAARRQRLAVHRRAGSGVGRARQAHRARTSACPDLATDPHFAKIGERRKNQQLMWTLINKFAEKYTKRELMAILNRARRAVRADHVAPQDLANDEHVRGRDMWVELDHPQRGKWFNVGMPIKLSASPAVIKRSPTLGEHTDEILKEVLGYDEQVTALRNAGAFSLPPKKAAYAAFFGKRHGGTQVPLRDLSPHSHNHKRTQWDEKRSIMVGIDLQTT